MWLSTEEVSGTDGMLPIHGILQEGGERPSRQRLERIPALDRSRLSGWRHAGCVWRWSVCHLPTAWPWLRFYPLYRRRVAVKFRNTGCPAPTAITGWHGEGIQPIAQVFWLSTAAIKHRPKEKNNEYLQAHHQDLTDMLYFRIFYIWTILRYVGQQDIASLNMSTCVSKKNSELPFYSSM